MKAVVLLMLGLAVVGCNKPGPVELRQDDTDALLEVVRIAPPDSNVSLSPVDSSATLPGDQVRFAGLLQVARVTFDGGPNRDTSIAYTRILFENRRLPVQGPFGRIVGYHGIDLGSITVNGNLVFRFPHRIAGRVGRPDTIAGTEYYRDLSTIHQPNTVYTWRATPDTLGPIATSIETPDNVVVDSPKGGAVIRRDRDLPMSWHGQGKIIIVISRLELGRARSLFMLRARENRRRAILPSKAVLRLLPPGKYVFTFVLANRRETDAVSGFAGQILVQAASVYNSYVELQ